MRIKTRFMPMIIGVLFIIAIGGTSIMGLWSSQENKEPVKFSSGTFEGLPDPEDIRGSFSFGDIGEAFDIEAAVIAKAFGIESNEPALIKAKDLETFYPDLEEGVEIGTGAIKTFVALYTGLPYYGDDGLPDTAVKVLMSEDKWGNEEQALYKDRIIQISETVNQKSEKIIETETETETSDVEHSPVVVGEIKGKTTVADLIEWGLTKEEVEQVLGYEVENVNIIIRDFCNSNGLAFGEIKSSLSELIK